MNLFAYFIDKLLLASGTLTNSPNTLLLFVNLLIFVYANNYFSLIKLTIGQQLIDN